MKAWKGQPLLHFLADVGNLCLHTCQTMVDKTLMLLTRVQPAYFLRRATGGPRRCRNVCACFALRRWPSPGDRLFRRLFFFHLRPPRRHRAPPEPDALCGRGAVAHRRRGSRLAAGAGCESTRHAPRVIFTPFLNAPRSGLTRLMDVLATLSTVPAPQSRAFLITTGPPWSRDTEMSLRYVFVKSPILDAVVQFLRRRAGCACKLWNPHLPLVFLAESSRPKGLWLTGSF